MIKGEPGTTGVQYRGMFEQISKGTREVFWRVKEGTLKVQGQSLNTKSRTTPSKEFRSSDSSWEVVNSFH